MVMNIYYLGHIVYKMSLIVCRVRLNCHYHVLENYNCFLLMIGTELISAKKNVEYAE